ncbi:multidrug resistance ABC transporter ATP-bindingand permease protein [Clostridium tetani 12124569]|nr:multidrug resistance ABC transporter ATP-bindingand permease protein [Clostridium tetani 12124569]
MDTLKRFTAYYKPYKGMFFMDMFCALTLSMIDLIFPLIVRYLLNDIYVNKSSSEIIYFVGLIGLGLLIMYVVKYFCQYYISSWGHIMGARMEADMREDIFLHLQKQSFSYYDSTNTGQLMSRIVNDLFDISELAHHGPEDLFISLLKILGSFIILMNINVKITSVLFFITLFMIYFSYFYNKK